VLVLISCRVDNAFADLVLPLESAGSMASQPERIASLETTVKIAKWILGIFIPAVIAWGAFVTVNVVEMKQALLDGGTTKLVAELKSPASPEQLRANLTTVIAQVQTANANGRKPDSQKVQAISAALSKVVQSNPGLPEAWSAAAEVVSFRNEISHPNLPALPECRIDQAKPEIIEKAIPNGKSWDMGYFFSKCRLKLEDVPPMLLTPSEWPKDWPVQFVEMNGAKGTHAGLPVYLTDGQVIYDGGPIAHEAGFVFIDCALRLKTKDVPDSRVRDILDLALKNEMIIEAAPNAPHKAIT
jgi:hypothetical protein